MNFNIGLALAFIAAACVGIKSGNTVYGFATLAGLASIYFFIKSIHNKEK
jgi:hypothetical protein